MRMLPNKYVFPEKPVIIKKQRAKIAHMSPPIYGLKDDARSAEADQKFAAILQNMYVNDDRLSVRSGFEKIATIGSGANAVEHLVPYYGDVPRLMAASNGTLSDAMSGLLLKAGFTSNDWHWTMHSDLGDTDYAVMVNGADGVWSWDGGTVADVGPITITKLGKNTAPATDCVVTVAAADISKFVNFDGVIISGADAGHLAANGPQRIANVNNPANTFTLMGTNASAWAGDQTTGTMRVVNQGSFTREAVKAPLGNTWLNVNALQIVVSHMNRLFFADTGNLAIYYLPLQQRYGELSVLPVTSIFKKGGNIKAMASWTVDGGRGMDDQLCIFTTNGEIAIYSGVDPDSDFRLVGTYHLSAPQSKWSVTNYGGELYFVSATGLTPMSAVLKSGREGMEASDKTVVARFQQYSFAYKENPGWELFFNPNSGRAMVNIPLGGGVYTQLARNMAKPSWTEFKNVPARCWGWVDPYLYFGDDAGNMYRMHPSIQSDEQFINGAWSKQAIVIDVQTGWSQYRTPAIKHFHMILPYILTDGFPQPSIDVQVDFDNSLPVNTPLPTQVGQNATMWDTAVWDVSPWTWGTKSWTDWTGVGSMGRVGAIRTRAAVYNCSFHILGWEVLYDTGSVFG